MNEHNEISGLLPFYAAGRLGEADRRSVERHLADCAECREELALWRVTAGEVVAMDRETVAPARPLNRALEQIRTTRRVSWGQRVGQLLLAQAPLVRREIWPATLAVMVIGYAAAMLAGQSMFISVLAPLMAAASLAVIYGPEHDPGLELALATPTSPRQVLLARLTLVFGYDLLLSLVASVGLLPILPEGTLGAVILGWLGPMTFLSAAALALSLWIGPTASITAAYGAWLSQFVVALQADAAWGPEVGRWLTAGALLYRAFWHSPLLLLVLAVPMFGVAFWLAGRQQPGFSLDGC
jgi:hypothetical protein